MAKKKIRNDISSSLGFAKTMYDDYDTYCDYLQRMTKICLSMFEYENLPETMDERYLERCLFFDGKAALLYTPEYGYVNTRAATNGFINIYGLPTKLNCYTDGQVFHTDRDVYSGINPDANKEDVCIYVRNNWDCVPTAATIQLFAERLCNAQRVIDVNINAQKTPVMLVGSDKQKLTLENLYAEYDGNKPVIYGDKDIITNESLKAVRTDAPYIADKVNAYKKEIWNEFLLFIGVNNIDLEKKERLISGESDANNEVINLNLQSYLVPRQKAIEEFNRLNGTNVKVKVRSDLANLIKLNESVVADYVDDGMINGSVKDGGINE